MAATARLGFPQPRFIPFCMASLAFIELELELATVLAFIFYSRGFTFLLSSVFFRCCLHPTIFLIRLHLHGVGYRSTIEIGTWSFSLLPLPTSVGPLFDGCTGRTVALDRGGGGGGERLCQSHFSLFDAFFPFRQGLVHARFRHVGMCFFFLFFFYCSFQTNRYCVV
ncbi:uncharacterized protein K452DRAFT_35507 [Aplosporella prunicola CBS 121167]|uniref:Uncharacterized protein n=1 Tax=Aplosporella prunicola CBS 121167 TaxID=1176127 RepID=A0A6A6AUM8_9PEZI|nr:uncharacterized protein K452DRAFT_35507 [Aplosporella prunicola CBS 121167]KAF2135296.1 hypothetical protein K452DRAFT_35507 [Aplosporella prunicola CBS 121167]